MSSPRAHALAIALLGACADRAPAPATPSAASASASASVTAAPSTSTSSVPAPIASAPPRPEPSPKCVERCNAEYQASKTSMCKFCRAHQIGAPRDRFEEFSRSCDETCRHEWEACTSRCDDRPR